MPAINNSFLVQSSNFVQSNDLVYRTVLDITGFELPYYLSSRNKDERRENLVNITVGGILGFVLAPLYVTGLNKVFAKKFLNNNKSFFRLNWNAVDPGNEKQAITQLRKVFKRTQERLNNPSWFDKIGYINKGIHKNLSQIDVAIKQIEKNPSILKNVYKSKKYVLYADLFLTTLGLITVGPLRNFVTKHFANKDRFTGTQDYLSDSDLKKLVKKDKNSDMLKYVINGFLLLAPFLTAFTAHNLTKYKIQKGLHPNKVLMKIRNSMDYSDGLFLSLGCLFSVFLAKHLNLVNWGRDKYEKIETTVKYSMIMPSFWLGDYIFNGNIAKIVDKLIAKTGKFKEGTFIRPEHSNILGAHPRPIKEVMESTAAHNASAAGKIATGIFLAGFLAHSLAMSVVLNIGNKMTKNWVKKDLKTINNSDTSNRKSESIKD